MKTFQCRVADADGTRKTLERTGPSREAILRDLAAQEYYILEVTEAVGPRGGATGRLPRRLVLEFTQALSLFLGNGLTLKEALRMAAEVYERPAQRRLWSSLAGSLEKGQSLREALDPWKGSFSPLYLGLIRLGEKTGDLAGVLERLAGYLKTAQDLREKTANALVYPALVLGVTVVGVVLLATLVLPALTTMVTSVNEGASKAYQQRILDVQGTLGLTLALVGALGAAVAATLWWGHRSPEIRRATDRILWKSPLGVVYLQKRFGLHLSFAMETLLAAGYSVESALEESLDVVSNQWIRAQLAQARESVIHGGRLSAALRRSGDFPQTLTAWVAVGEGGNDLAQSFAQLRAHYQHELEMVHSRFANLVEPTFIVLVGALLVAVVLNFVAPIFTMLGGLIS